MNWKPCPICGTTEDLGFAINSPRKSLWVYCLACDHHGPKVDDVTANHEATEREVFINENEAISLWNSHEHKPAQGTEGAKT